MIQIRFSDPSVERRALGFLAGRFSFTSSSDGTTLVPPAAIEAMTSMGIQVMQADKQERRDVSQGPTHPDRRQIE
jgi:hypothetical protein